jgi:hypothetical protein
MSIARSNRAWSLPAFGILLFTCSAAGDKSHHSCVTPMVFKDAAVNVVVLPYRYAAGNDSSLNDMGNRLSLLVKLNVLSHILDYGSVGAVQMELPPGVPQDDRACQPEIILPQLLGGTPGAAQELGVGHGLVLVWGLLYQEGDDVFVQTYARFLRRGVEEDITFGAIGISFSGKPSAQLLAFTPQKLSQKQLEQIESDYEQADFVRTEPGDNAPGERLPRGVAKCVGNCGNSSLYGALYVEERRGEWIRVRWMDPAGHENKQGWIHAAGNLEGTQLDKVLPELKFIEGCAGYLRQRVADAENHQSSKELSALAVTELKDFVGPADVEPTDMGSAVALQLAGILEYTSGRQSLDFLIRASQNFEQARKIIPSDPDAITLAVAAQVSREWTEKGKFERTSQKAQLLSAAAALSSNNTALSNLSSLYRVILKTADTTAAPDNLTRSDVEKRLRVVDSLASTR